MNSTHLNEHDANQGAQSSGEFLGMTGNSGWYLLGSGGATILMVIFLWGIFGVSLLLCLFVGVILCLGSLAYVFTLKNNKPEHYDTDFFESALVEAGVVQFSFGPRARRLVNPFSEIGCDASEQCAENRPLRSGAHSASRQNNRAASRSETTAVSLDHAVTEKSDPGKAEAVVTRRDYEHLQDQLATAEEMLDEALAESPED